MGRIVPVNVLIAPRPTIAGTWGYSTNFPATQNPMVQDGGWINGADPLSTVVQTTTGKAMGTQTGSGPGEPYDDSQAWRTDFPTNHECQAVVGLKGGLSPDTPHREVELLLGMSIGPEYSPSGGAFGPTVTYGYEINWAYDGAYLNLGRYKNPGLIEQTGPDSDCPAPVDGDLIRARLLDGVIAFWINDVLIFEYDDSSNPAGALIGNPGLGFFIRPGAAHDDFYLKSWQGTAL